MYSIRSVLPWICIHCLVALAVLPAFPGTIDIVNGLKLTTDEVPYLVQLRDEGGGPAFCAGTILTPKYVITAAHCFKGREPEHVRIFAGPHGRRVDLGIAKLTIHPEYSHDTLYTDIAIIELDDYMFLFRTNDVLSLCTAPMRPGELVDVSGWERTGKERWPADLLTARLTVTTQEVCQRHYWKFAVKNTFCAGGDLEAKGHWNGVTGGPAVHDGELCGIVNIGSKHCDTVTHPSALTDVYSLLWFIESVIPELF